MKDFSTELFNISKALVFIPHPDDEVIGCGGLLYNLAKLGCDIVIVLVTNGDGGGALPSNTSELRLNEFKRSLYTLGIRTEAKYWMLPDGKLHREKQLGRQIQSIISEEKASLIVSPWFGDNHLDHQVIGNYVNRANTRKDSITLYYEVWNPCPANAYLDISAAWSTKKNALQAHETALKYRDYLRVMEGLATYRSLLVPFKSDTKDQYAEAYLIKKSQTFCFKTWVQRWGPGPCSE